MQKILIIHQEIFTQWLFTFSSSYCPSWNSRPQSVVFIHSFLSLNCFARWEVAILTDCCKCCFFFQCLSSGVCGGCAPAPAPSCTPASCSPGYSCGSYGCARNRARSSLTKKIVNAFLYSETVIEKTCSGILFYAPTQNTKKDDSYTRPKLTFFVVTFQC